MKKTFIIFLLSALTISIRAGFADNTELKISNEKYSLKNGLDVILHEDKSDPIAAIAIQYHVGSNREVKGRTGFAHLFEHMMFQESQHVGQDQFFKKIQGAGGELNGGTWEDGTIYFQVVPQNYLEMVLWLESDRMGYLLSTVTDEAFKNQQEVVQNEKRQRYDNQPYGQTNYVIEKLLYPEDHPYNWQVIGSLNDLRNATLKDVHEFYKKWYGPDNATLVVAGSFDKEQVKEWIEKYFGEIKPSGGIKNPTAIPVKLDEMKRYYYEDNFAKSPQLCMVFPTVEQFTDDSYALGILADLLGDGKKAPLYKIIVEEKKLAPSVSVFQNSQEITGVFQIRITSFPGKNLGDVEKAIKEALQKFENEGFTDQDLQRIKTKSETNFYNGIASLLDKAQQLAIYNEYAGSPDYITTDLNRILSVTKEDVWRVYEKYVKNKNYVLTNFVPRGQVNLAAENSKVFEIKEETTKQADSSGNQEKMKVEKITSSFDRTKEPAPAKDPELNLPFVWQNKLSNGIKIMGIVQNEIPLIQFNVTVKGGMLLDDPRKIGTANLISDMLMEGTKNKTPVELEEAIDNLGASIRVFTTRESIVLQANCLSSKFEEVYKLAEEIVLEPRWDEKEFARKKSENVERVNRGRANPAVVATNIFNKLVYGEHILGNPIIGTEETINIIGIDDLKEYYVKNFSPSLSYVTVAGDISEERVLSAFKSLESRWKEKEVEFKKYLLPEPVKQPTIYFVDVPGAKQSELRIGYLALPYTNPDFYPAVVMNYKLGGSFNGILNLILREEKGYTYGARSNFSGTIYPGPFLASTAVQSDATFESVKIIRDEITKYTEGISDEDLSFTRNSLQKSNARNFETLGSLIGMLDKIANYNLPADYVKNEEQIILNMSRENHRQIARKYLDTGRLIYLVVGDAKTQLENLKQLGLGNPILLDINGKRI